LKSVPGRAYTEVHFLSIAELGFFHFLEIMTGWLLPSASQKTTIQHGWYLPPQKILLAGNRFLQAGKGAENTKENSWQCFRVMFKHVASPNRRKKEIVHHIL
jgi:hypothetical protein